MRPVIVCYSHSKNNQLLARELQKRTDADFLLIEERKKRTRFGIFVDIFFNRVPAIKEYAKFQEKFQHCILVGPIWGGKIATPIKAFLLKERGNIDSYSFISICGGAPEQKPKIVSELTRLARQRPVAVTQLPLTKLKPGNPSELINYKVNKNELAVFEDEISDFLDCVCETDLVETA